MPPPVDIRLAAPGDGPGMGAVLARAFLDDPLMEHLVPARDHERRLRRIFTFEAEALRARGRVYTTADGAGAALWAAPKRWRMPVREMVASAPTMLRAFGRGIPRAMRMQSRVEACHRAQEPHWYLAVLGTDPARQGQGIGSALMVPVLDECDRDGIGAYLESSNEANVPFYVRHGFEVTEEIPLPRGPSVWGMWRSPQPS